MLELRREIGSEEVDSTSLAEMRRVNKIRRDFVANVSHELKTPATSLKLLAESLVEIMDEDPDQARCFAEQLKNETERLAQLITDLLDLARLESEEGVQNPAPVDVRSILMAVLARIRPTPVGRTSPSPGSAQTAPARTPLEETRRSSSLCAPTSWTTP